MISEDRINKMFLNTNFKFFQHELGITHTIHYVSIQLLSISDLLSIACT